MNASLLASPIKIETLVLVAIWQSPFVFQGVFSITAINADVQGFLFFRCLYPNSHSAMHIDNAFSSEAYHFSHLYNEQEQIALDTLDEGMLYTLYILKYALHLTLLEMANSSRQCRSVLDEEAMDAIIQRFSPMIQQGESLMNKQEEVGFAASMDFYPKERMARMAVNALFKHFLCKDPGKIRH